MKKAYVLVKTRENYEVLKPLKDATEWELNNLPRVVIDSHTKERKVIDVDTLYNMDWDYVLEPRRKDYKQYTIEDSMFRTLTD